MINNHACQRTPPDLPSFPTSSVVPLRWRSKVLTSVGSDIAIAITIASYNSYSYSYGTRCLELCTRRCQARRQVVRQVIVSIVMFVIMNIIYIYMISAHACCPPATCMLRACARLGRQNSIRKMFQPISATYDDSRMLTDTRRALSMICLHRDD